MNLIKNFYRIKLVDKYLIALMIILLIETAYTIFFAPIKDANTFSKVDLVIRTSISGIFGYFLSANFISCECPNKHKNSGSCTANKSKNHVKIEEKFESENEQANCPLKKIETDMQITIVSLIGLIAITITIITRNFELEDTVNLAAMSQIRDIGVGSIGFLIGYPNDKNR